MLTSQRKLRKIRVRAKLLGTGSRPRLCIFRSNKYIYAQLINDEKGLTLASAKGEKGAIVAEEIVAQAAKKKIKQVVFDKSGYKYHGKVKEIGETLRSKGLLN